MTVSIKLFHNCKFLLMLSFIRKFLLNNLFQTLSLSLSINDIDFIFNLHHLSFFLSVFFSFFKYHILQFFLSSFCFFSLFFHFFILLKFFLFNSLQSFKILLFVINCHHFLIFYCCIIIFISPYNFTLRFILSQL